MPSIQPYLAIGVLFDYTQTVPTIVITDTGSYPGGVADLVKGNLTITQPDGMTRQNADFSNPDIQWNGTALNTFSMPLRLDCNGGVQQGVYTITYNVQAAGYSSGFITKSFAFTFTIPTGVISPNFDVFTPSLTAADNTAYNVPGFSYTINRLFSGYFTPATGAVTVSTSGATLDLKYNGSYWDSAYTLSLNSILTYTWLSENYLTVKCLVTAQNPLSTGVLTANTPPSCQSMINQYNTYRSQVEALACACGSSDLVTSNLNEATALINSINTNLGNATYTGLYNLILSFENIVTNGTYIYTNTGLAIAAYVYNCGSGGSGGGGGTVNSVPVSFTVGQPGYLIAGQNNVTIPALATGTGNPKTIVIFQKGGLTEVPGTNYNFTPATGNIQLLAGDIFNNNEQVYIFAIY